MWGLMKFSKAINVVNTKVFNTIAEYMNDKVLSFGYILYEDHRKV